MIELVVRSQPVIDELSAASQQLQQQRRAALLRAALIVEREAKKRAPHDTGRLRSSISHDVRDHEAVVGTNVIYARQREFGGTIVPKQAKALTIPVAKEAKRRRAEDFPDLFLVKRPGKDAVLALKSGKSLKVMFVLKQAVTQKGSLYLHGALEATKDDVRKVFESFVRGVVHA
jgi:hypothetical protein